MANGPQETEPAWSQEGVGVLVEAGDARIQELLGKTSRTFALVIPRLPQPTCREVSLAYLLFRIADTLEDAGARWDRARQLEALDQYAALLCSFSAAQARRCAELWLAPPSPSEHAGYLELLAELPTVLGAVEKLAESPRRILVEHTLRTAAGMASFVSRTRADGVLELADLDELRAYCYAVAGIVGEMVTELFLLGWPTLEPAAAILRERAPVFGEALQLVNVLKDSADDQMEGRRYLPAAVERAEVFELARRDLDVAAAYVLDRSSPRIFRRNRV